MSYSFEEGKIYALVGPNGAGKTTLIQMISGISEPMKGQIRLDDQDTLLRKSKSQIGYALELTGIIQTDSLQFYGWCVILSLEENIKKISCHF